MKESSSFAVIMMDSRPFSQCATIIADCLLYIPLLYIQLVFHDTHGLTFKNERNRFSSQILKTEKKATKKITHKQITYSPLWCKSKSVRVCVCLYENVVFH